MTDMPLPPIRRRWRVRFTLRILLVAVTVLCIWLAIHTQRARQQQQVMKGLRTVPKTKILYDYEFKNGTFFWKDVVAASYEPAESPIPRALIDALGVDFFHTATMVYLTDPEALPRLAELPSLECLQVNCDELDDDDLVVLPRINGLRSVFLYPTDDRILASTTRIGDASLKTIGQLPNIETVSLRGTNLSAAGLAALAEAKSLRDVHIEGCREDLQSNAVVPLEKAGNIKTLTVFAGIGKGSRLIH